MVVAGGALCVVVGAVSGAISRADAPRTLLGDEAAVGNGTARVYVDVAADGAPTAIGVALTSGALTGLATHMNTTSRCFDKDGDGHLMHGECLGDYESVLSVPEGVEADGLPFKWIMLNWNPEGHAEPAPHAWSAAHFDFHFMTAEPELIRAIRSGPCAELIDCDDFRTASLPLPAEQAPDGYVDVGAAVAAMGNHLVDSQDPEIADPTLGFTKTFIYGVYGGRMIFLEPMVSHAYIASKPNECGLVRTPASYAEPGYYPTRHCVRYDALTDTYRISLEGLVLR